VIKGINESLLSTLAACGDVNRNVLAPPTPAYTKAREQVLPTRTKRRARARAADQGVSLHLD
jgi:sulfite reductase beta subunit-like hemoprotein